MAKSDTKKVKSPEIEIFWDGDIPKAYYFKRNEYSILAKVENGRYILSRYGWDEDPNKGECIIVSKPDTARLMDSLKVSKPDAELVYQFVDGDVPEDQREAKAVSRRATDGKLSFDDLTEDHPYYIRAYYPETKTHYESKPSDWQRVYTRFDPVEGVEMIGEPLIGQTLKARVTPNTHEKDFVYIWLRDGEIAKLEVIDDDDDIGGMCFEVFLKLPHHTPGEFVEAGAFHP